MTDRDDRIREVAYLLWLDEGCPQGQAERHWQIAETQFDSDQRKRIEGEPPGDLADDAPRGDQPALADSARRRNNLKQN